jgi:alpha-L-rhamnosidase
MEIAMRISLLLALLLVCGTQAQDLEKTFLSPPDAARPGVYWYFMDGNQTREGMVADLEAMHAAGLRKALFLEVNIGVPRGPVDFMSEAWQDNFAFAVQNADRLGIEIILGTGPGWAGAGGPWIDPGRAMQHLRGEAVQVKGPAAFTGKLPVPQPSKPSHFAGLSKPLTEKRQAQYQDVAVLAYPTRQKHDPIDKLDFKSLLDVQPYSIWKHVPRFVPSQAVYPAVPEAAVVMPQAVIDLTSRMKPDGSLDWQIPEGEWTIMRFVSRATGATTRPAPTPGHGFEVDRFSSEAFQYHFDQFHQKLLDKIGKRNKGRGLTTLHLDSWESSSQNWTPEFRTAFKKLRGYDPLPFFPAYTGQVVGSREMTERFLWDLRRTAQDLTLEHHAGAIKRLSHRNGLSFSCEPYDMNPAGDLDLGGVADIPMCEFWSSGVDSSYSCFEASSIAHTLGRPVVRAEAFTTPPGIGHKHNPAELKNQTDWAFCMGINDFIFHTFQHQPLGLEGPKPGMAMGPYGLQWTRNQTFWPMVGAYHDYLARCGQMLRQGVSVTDILYLTPEGAPHIFEPPEDAVTRKDLMREKKDYHFDVVSPLILMDRATVEGGLICFEDGSSYRVLVLPLVETMTPELLTTLERLVRKGATIQGLPPKKSPSLVDYPRCDTRVAELVQELWGKGPLPAEATEYTYRKGRLLLGGAYTAPASNDKLYPSYASTVAFLQKQGIMPALQSPGNLRYICRQTKELDIFFVGNREATQQCVTASFRTEGGQPEFWNPVNGSRRILPEAKRIEQGGVAIPLTFDAYESGFVVFKRKSKELFQGKGAVVLGASNFPALKPVINLTNTWEVTFDPQWGGPKSPVPFQELVDWSKHADPAIKYYSGIAVYRQIFDLQESQISNLKSKIFLSLGMVQKIARVRLNGEVIGIAWTPPYRLDVTGKVLPTGNVLEIEVANTWANRLIGDQQPADKGVRTLRWENGLLEGKSYPAGRYTVTTANVYKPTSPLQESGLLGPVQLVR